MKYRAYLAASLAVLFAAGCNSGHSNAPYEAVFPTVEDRYEGSGDDDNYTRASTIKVGAELQSRSIFPQGDQDWVAVKLTEGMTYEFFTTNLNAVGGTVLELYEANGTRQMTADDNYIQNDSHIGAYEARYTGTHYLAVRSTQPETLTSYQLGVRLHVDADGDGFTPTYDCNDHNDTIHPWAVEIAGDGIDQDCSGDDAPDVASADRYEPDDDFAHAGELFETEAAVQELQYQTKLYRNVHTIHEAGQQDFFRVTLSPHTAAYLMDYTFDSSQVEIRATLLEQNGSEITSDNGWIDLKIENTADTDQEFYVRFEASDGLKRTWYAPALIPLGEDRDGDGFYTREENADCDDTNASIAPFGAETAGDGIDGNCNGNDDA